ncbi:MAG: basic amino acid ABC transporter substrate-binding protein [Chloroflexales bacterium]
MHRHPWMRMLSMLLLTVGVLAGCGSAPAAVPSTGTTVSLTAAAIAPTTSAVGTAAVATHAAGDVAMTTVAVVSTAVAVVAEASGTPVTPTAAVTTTPSVAVTVADLKGRKVLIGTEAAYPPFESVDATTNQIVGFDIDLMNAVAKLINIQPEFQNAAFDTIFAALQKKQFDAVMSAATITAERTKIIAFSNPYIEIGQIVVTLKSNTAIKSYTDLATASAVGVQTGTTGETAALKEGKVPDANLKRYQAIDLAFADLANNAIDAVVADSPTVGNYISQPQYVDKLQVIGAPFTTESYGIAVQQDDSELLNAINAALVKLKADGFIDQLKAKYKIK